MFWASLANSRIPRILRKNLRLPPPWRASAARNRLFWAKSFTFRRPAWWWELMALCPFFTRFPLPRLTACVILPGWRPGVTWADRKGLFLARWLRRGFCFGRPPGCQAGACPPEVSGEPRCVGGRFGVVRPFSSSTSHGGVFGGPETNSGGGGPILALPFVLPAFCLCRGLACLLLAFLERPG